MYVIKRDQSREPVNLNMITDRIKPLCSVLRVDHMEVVLAVVEGMYSGVTTSKLDDLAAEIAVSKGLEHPDYYKLGARIAVSNLHKETKACFVETMEDLHRAGRVSDKLLDLARRNEVALMHDRDYSYTYFGLKTLQHSYLMKDRTGKTLERPQHMLMRVALCLHYDDMDGPPFKLTRTLHCLPTTGPPQGHTTQNLDQNIRCCGPLFTHNRPAV